ncbi:MAG TPA: DUF1554 domain-containing protein [Labilithrix sp.]|nr:DUF1554 domain-containing protein [Labilithrix sp.]
MRRRAIHRPIPASRSIAAAISAVAIAGCTLLSGADDLGIAHGVDEEAPAPNASEDGDAGAPGSIVVSESGTEPPPDTTIRPSKPDASDAATREAGPGTKLVFVTTSRWNGSLGGLAGADALCKQAAAEAGLGSSDWRAWLSTKSVNATSRITHDGPYVLLDGRVVVSNKAQLASGAINVAIDITEQGIPADKGTEYARIWTGTHRDGTAVPPDMCDDWTSSGSLEFGIMGSLLSAKAAWTRASGVVQTDGGWGCQTKGRLYCFEL